MSEWPITNIPISRAPESLCHVTYSDVVGEESERWVAVVPDASVDDATSEQSATLDVILRGVQVFVNLKRK